MLRTPFTELFGCEVPLQQAGMGGVATVELARAVAAAGGMGMLGLAGPHAPDVIDRLTAPGDGVERGAVGVNFLHPFLDRDVLTRAAASVPLVELFYGDPDPGIVDAIHAGGARAGWQVGRVDEARAAVDAGCDVVVVQGVEAGGHVRGELPLLPLLGQVLDVVDVPVVAAGGIGTARAMAAALAAGAAAVRVGTRFVATREADVHPTYLQALIAAGPDDTVLTTAFSLLWPDAPHRVLRSAVTAAEAFVAEDDMVGRLRFGGQEIPLMRWASLPPTRDTEGAIEAMALYAGQSVGAVSREDRAADVVRELCEGAEALLRRWRD